MKESKKVAIIGAGSGIGAQVAKTENTSREAQVIQIGGRGSGKTTALEKAINQAKVVREHEIKMEEAKKNAEDLENFQYNIFESYWDKFMDLKFAYALPTKTVVMQDKIKDLGFGTFKAFFDEANNIHKKKSKLSRANRDFIMKFLIYFGQFVNQQKAAETKAAEATNDAIDEVIIKPAE